MLSRLRKQEQICTLYAGESEWQACDITLIGRNITVVQNGQTIIDNQEIPGITGGALDSHEERPGPIYLQGSEDGKVSFRNIVITPAKESSLTLQSAPLLLPHPFRCAISSRTLQCDSTAASLSCGGSLNLRESIPH